MANTVGIREAKIQLSAILRRVRRGAEVVITDRGRPVGKIVPVGDSPADLEGLVRDLEARGVIAGKGAGAGRLRPPVHAPSGIAQTLLEEDRG